MVNSRIFFENVLQRLRFSRVKKLLKGDVLDFGGNNGELGKYIKGNYTYVNYDHSLIIGQKYDTIVLLAVIEHLEVEEAYEIFHNFHDHLRKDGHIVITTPSRFSKYILEFLGWLNLLDKNNLSEHKHYWNQSDFEHLAARLKYKIDHFQYFQFGLNQLLILSEI